MSDPRIERTEVKTFLVQALCAECEQELRYTGYCQPMSPPKYAHACPNGHGLMLLTTYPYYGYEPVSL